VYLKLAREQCVSLGLLQKATFAHFKAFSDFCADTCLQRTKNQPLTDEQGERLLALLTQAGAIGSDFRRSLEAIARDNADYFERNPMEQMSTDLAGMPCSAPVDCAPARSLHVLRHMRPNLHFPQQSCKLTGVVCLVGAHAGNRLAPPPAIMHHQQGRFALGRAIGFTTRAKRGDKRLSHREPLFRGHLRTCGQSGLLAG
jgi:hypothetical protein